jgi:hypothetical protein
MLHEVPRLLNQLKSKYVTVQVSLNTDSKNVEVYLDDGVSSTGVMATGSGDTEVVTVTHEVSASTTKLELIINCSGASEQLNIYSVYCNIGPSFVPGLACIVQGRIGEVHTYNHTNVTPLGELERNGIEIPDGYTRLESVLNGKFGTGGNGRSKLPDGRGYFDRQWDHGAGTDDDAATRTDRGDGTAGDNVGTIQGDQMQGHNHLPRGETGFVVAPSGTGGNTLPGATLVGGTIQAQSKTGDPTNDGTNGTPRTGLQTHGKNIATLKTINYGRRV